MMVVMSTRFSPFAPVLGASHLVITEHSALSTVHRFSALRTARPHFAPVLGASHLVITEHCAPPLATSH